MTQSGLRLEQIRISLHGAVMIALDENVAPGEVLSVMGPSGAGKSTLLAAISGTLAPQFRLEGRIWLDETDLTGRPTEARRIGILFQDELLFPHMSVGANVAFGLPAHIKGSKARRARVAEALADVGLDGFADRAPDTLSGGQRARAALVRMLLAEPCALLLDEAFTRLDADLRDQIRDLVFGEARKRGLPVVQVTHDQGDAAAAGGRILRLGSRG
jgi:putative thiamine transport system ATP-binding protein